MVGIRAARNRGTLNGPAVAALDSPAMPSSRRAARAAQAQARSARRAGAARSTLVQHADPALPAGAARRLGLAAFAVIAAYAIVLLFLALGPHRIGDYFTETDFYGAYADGARAIQHGVLDPSRYGVVGPGYEVALAIAGALVGDLLRAAELLSVLAMTAGLLLWHRLLARRTDPRLALGAVLFMAVNATFIRYGYSATTDALAFALQAAALYLLLVRGGWRGALAAGLVSALAFLTRYNAGTLLPAGLLAILAGGTRHRDLRRAALLFAAGFALPVLPWVLWSLAQGGRFASQLHHNIAYDVFARARGIAWDDYQRTMQPEFQSLWDVVGRDPVAVLRREAFNVYDHLRRDFTDLLGAPVAVCVAIGASLALVDGTLRRAWAIWAAAGLLFLSLVPVFYSERYSLPLLPAYAALAAAAFASPRFAYPVGRVWLKPFLIAIPLALTVPATQRYLARALEQLPVEVLDVAKTLRERARPGDRVVARKPHLAYHAGIQAAPFPFADSLGQLADDARRARARWLYFSWPEAEMRPQFDYLLDTAAAVPGLTVRYASGERPAVLYEIGPAFGRDPAWLSDPAQLRWHRARGLLRVNPHHPDALYNAAFVEASRGDLETARQRLELLTRLRPRDLRALLLLGEVHLNREDAAGAEAAFSRAARIAPTDPHARLGLGWANLLARRVVDAARLWRPVIGAAEDPATLQRMIEVFRAVGDSAGAAEARAALARARRP